MRTYTMKKIQGTPSWNEIPVMLIDNLLWTDSIDVSAQAQICWDEDALYLRMEAVEPNIRMKENGPLAEVCNDSCLEFFFCPMEGDMRYFNIEFNPNTCLYLGIGTNVEDLTRLIPEEEPNNGTKFVFQPIVNRTEDGWEIRYTVPFAFIRFFFPEFSGAAVFADEGVDHLAGVLTGLRI